jgi:hypothetical protein
MHLQSENSKRDSGKIADHLLHFMSRICFKTNGFVNKEFSASPLGVVVEDNILGEGLTTKDMKTSNSVATKPWKIAAFPDSYCNIWSFFEALRNNI